LVSALATGLFAQNPPNPTSGTIQGTAPPPTGSIAGRIVDGDTGTPVPGAIVTLEGGPPAPPTRTAQNTIISSRRPNLITGGDGQFVFRGLGSGNFSVSAAKPGYLLSVYGASRPNGGQQSFMLAQGEQRSDIVVRMFRTASIGGRVVDDLGEPLVGARVIAGRRQAAGLRPNSGFQSVATTDDRGSYRISGLSPGEYTVGIVITQSSVPATGPAGPAAGTFVSADRRFVLAGGGALGAVQDGSGRLMSYATTFYPSVRTSAEAAAILLRPGDERLSIDLTVPLLPAATVSGQITSPDGQAGGYQLRLTATETGGVPTDVATAQTTSGPDGSFVFLGVPRGRYILQTERMPRPTPPVTQPDGRVVVASADPMLFAFVPVSVGEADVSGLTVVTRPGVTISGRVALEGAAPPAGTRTSMNLTIEALDGGTRSTMTIQIAGPLTPFSSSSLTPGRYRLTIGDTMRITATSAGPGEWVLKSAMAGDIDVTDGPFEITDAGLPDVAITLTDRPSTIAGTVRTSGNPDPTAVVLAFPTDTKLWPVAAGVPRRFVSLRVNPQGTFGPVNFRPGDYHVIAIADEQADEWMEMRSLEVLARSATRVTLGEGQRLSLDLTRATPRLPPSPTPYAGLLAFRGFQVRDARTAPPPKEPGPGAVSGTVVAADEGNRPIPRARINLRPLEGRQDFATISDAAGRFVFSRLPAGRYTMTVSKPAYLTAYYGTGEGVLPPGLPINVVEGKAVTGVALRLVRGGVITGVVIDQHGQPMMGARIQVLQPFGDDRRLSPITIQGAPLTDSRGVYRIFGLQPGAFAVAAQPSQFVPAGELRDAGNPARAVAYAPIYYPGTPMAHEATLVDVAAGRDTTGIDLPIRLVPAARLEGTVTSADGQTVPFVQVQILPRAPSQLQAARSASGHTPADGMSSQFYATDVVPGQYSVIARAVDRRTPSPNSTTNALLWGQQDVDVFGDDLVGISIVLHPALTLAGRVVLEGTTAEAVPDSRTLRVMLNATGSSGLSGPMPLAVVDEAGRFFISNIVPGRYKFGASALSLVGTSPPGIWSLQSAMAGGRDLLDYPLDVRPGQPAPEIVLTYSNQTAELSGRLLDGAGKPMRSMSILLFGTDRAVWSRESRRVRAPIQPADDGSFRFINLLPGEYFLGVMTEVDPKQAGDPALLEQLAQHAIRVAIAPGEKKTQDIRIAGPPLAGARAGSSARR
jgi:protocatechuate 3,4-dioxygenase beta subunit